MIIRGVLVLGKQIPLPKRREKGDLPLPGCKF